MLAVAEMEEIERHAYLFEEKGVNGEHKLSLGILSTYSPMPL